MAAFPVSWPRKPDPARNVSVSDRSLVTAALGPSSPGCPVMATWISWIFWFFDRNRGDVVTEVTESMWSPPSAVASASIFCRSGAVSTESSVALTAMMPDAEATDGKSFTAIVSACVDWYEAGRP